MLVCLALSYALCADGHLDTVDGIVLFAGLLGLFGTLAWLSMSGGPADALGQEMVHHLEGGMTTGRAIMWFSLGLGLLLFGSNMLVDGAVTVATHYGVSDLVIGLTIVAVGTSLPELAASIASALKGESDIALGNVIGSNMFNILGVMAVPALLRPGALEPAVMSRDFPIMILLSVLLFLMAARRGGPRRITRTEGAILLAGFTAYQALLFTVS